VVVDKEYLVRQALTLLNLAFATKDTKVSAGLIQKAADLKAQIDEAPPADLSPHAPDVQGPPEGA
jgi:hypothetical protein